jgi:hypothetical protein
LKGGFAAIGASILIMGIGCQKSSGTEAVVSTANSVAATTATPEKKPEPPAPEPRFKAFKKPEMVKGLYLTAWGAGSSKRLDNMIALLEKTELNSLVIDVRDAGEMYFKTGIKLADESGANHIAVVNHEKMFEKLEKGGVYPIARISCFRDEFVPLKFVDLAVQTPDGKPWRDRSGHEWLDPYNKKNWDYIAETVEWAIDAGFPEVQLDYVRFPSEGKSSTQRFPAKDSYPNKDAKPEDVIAEFAKYIRDKVKAKGAAYSADIFGIISSGKADQGIGQELEKVSEPFDVISPMVYPSHYAKGEYGIADPNVKPYEIVKKSLADYKKKLPGKPLRPWLQDFFGYGKAEVHAQIRAAKELGYDEYLIWNARNRYTESAYVVPKGQTEAVVAKRDPEPEPEKIAETSADTTKTGN